MAGRTKSRDFTICLVNLSRADQDTVSYSWVRWAFLKGAGIPDKSDGVENLHYRQSEAVLA